MAGWSIIASGRAEAEDVIAVLRQGLENLKALPGARNVTTDLAAGPGGWSLSASGDGDNPDDHALVLSHVQGLVASPDAETGTSEINGPFVAAQNFHTVPAQPVAPAADAGAGPATPAG